MIQNARSYINRLLETAKNKEHEKKLYLMFEKIAMTRTEVPLQSSNNYKETLALESTEKNNSRKRKVKRNSQQKHKNRPKFARFSSILKY